MMRVVVLLMSAGHRHLRGSPSNESVTSSSRGAGSPHDCPPSSDTGHRTNMPSHPHTLQQTTLSLTKHVIKVNPSNLGGYVMFTWK